MSSFLIRCELTYLWDSGTNFALHEIAEVIQKLVALCKEDDMFFNSSALSDEKHARSTHTPLIPEQVQRMRWKVMSPTECTSFWNSGDNGCPRSFEGPIHI